MKAFSVGTLSLCNNGILRFFMVVTQGTKDIKKNTFKEFRVLEVLERSEKKKKQCVVECTKNHLNIGKEAHNYQERQGKKKKIGVMRCSCHKHATIIKSEPLRTDCFSSSLVIGSKINLKK